MNVRPYRRSTIWLVKLALVLSATAPLSEGNAGEVSSRSPTPPLSSPPSRRPPWIGEACKEEFSSLCGHLPLNSQRDAIVQCLKEHQESLSQDCATAISDRRDAAQL